MTGNGDVNNIGNGINDTDNGGKDLEPGIANWSKPLAAISSVCLPLPCYVPC